jgi:glutathione S-transferase
MVLEEIGEPFEARRIDATKGENRTPDYLKLHPRAHVPVLVQGDFVLTEAAAIMVHLADTHPDKKLLPALGTKDRARALEWCGFLAATVHVAFRTLFRPERFSEDPAAHASIKAHGRAKLLAHYAEIESRLVGQWALGTEYSIVDPYLLTMNRWGHRIEADMSVFPRYAAHAAAVAARPAVIRSMNTEEITPTGMK